MRRNLMTSPYPAQQPQGQQPQGQQPQGQQPGDAQTREMTLSVARTVATQIANKVRTDPAFTAQLVANPRQTLEANGVPSESVNDLIGAAGRLPVGRPD